MRVILDTNVLFAATRSNLGASFELLRSLGTGDFTIAISAPLVFEYEEVLVRELVPRFLSVGEVAELINYVCEVGARFDPQHRVRPLLADPDDDFIVELALAAGVEYIVTFDVGDFAAAMPLGVKSITPGDFVRLLRGVR